MTFTLNVMYVWMPILLGIVNEEERQDLMVYLNLRYGWWNLNDIMTKFTTWSHAI